MTVNTSPDDQASGLRELAGTRKTITLHAVKQCKGSVRYGTPDPKAPFSDVYVRRETWPVMPESVVVSIEPGTH